MPPTADDVLMESGGLGRFQVRILVLLGILIFPSAFLTYMPMFMLTVPKHRCAIEGRGNDTYAIQSPSHSMMVNTSIPWENEEDGVRSSCHIYSTPQGTGNGTNTREKCSHFVYDKTFFLNSFIEKFDLVCDRLHWRTTANSVMMTGKTIAAITQGVLCDVFGRRRSCLFLIVLTLIGSIASAFPMDIPSLIISRLVAGFCTTSIYLASYVTALEFMCPQHRRMFLVIWSVVWVAGGFTLTGVAYLVRDSQQLILVVSVPSVLLLSYYWLIPESPRWLLSKGDTKKAKEVFEYIAKTNGKEFPAEIFEDVVANVIADKRKAEANGVKVTKDNDEAVVEGKKRKENLLYLLSYKKMAFQFAILLFNWMANSMTYYALMFNVSNLPGSIYTNFMLLNCVDVVSNIISYAVLDRFGRKWSYAGFMLVAVLGCLLCIIPIFVQGPDSLVAFNALALLGRAGISTSFSIIYLLSSELVPTSVRSSSLGAFSMSSKMGSIFSPYVADLGLLVGGNFKEVLPMMVCGGVALTALLFSLVLPETMGKDLPNTIADSLAANKISDKKNQHCPQPLMNMATESEKL